MNEEVSFSEGGHEKKIVEDFWREMAQQVCEVLFNHAHRRGTGDGGGDKFFHVTKMFFIHFCDCNRKCELKFLSVSVYIPC